jgi:glucose uptake protein GlcU
MHSWSYSHVVLVLALLALVIGVVLLLSVVAKHDDELENDRANTTRSSLILLAAIALFLFVLAVQRVELAHAVKHLME